MVSIRRRKLLAICSGQNSFLAPIPWAFDYGHTTQNCSECQNLAIVHPLPSNDGYKPKEETALETGAGSSNTSAPSQSKEIQQFTDFNVLGIDTSYKFLHIITQAKKPMRFHDSFPVVPIHNVMSGQYEVKRRKRHRRKHVENQESCIMRGVYFKNMKWQAAIKVDKKQIHLGTVGSQEEAARLYDRAAFMCGREPNFELSEEEKKELIKYKWDEFLAITRSAITNKKSQRRTGPGPKVRAIDNDWEPQQGHNSFSASEDDTSLAP